MIDIDIFKEGWASNETPCGWGSELNHTQYIRNDLPLLIKQYNIKIINDAGCGDLNWIKHVNLANIDYIGYDIIKRDSWNNTNLKCQIFDISQDIMRPCDLIICRDVFIHMPNTIILQILSLFKQSSKLLLSTMFDIPSNSNINLIRPAYFTKTHSKLNLQLVPFNLEPLNFKIKEDYPNKYSQLYNI